MKNEILKWLKMARIDIKNQGEGNDVKVKVLEGEHCDVTKPQWFYGEGCGYVLETIDKHLMLELECHGAGILIVRLMGVDRRNKNGERLPLWVDYTRLAVNEKMIFWEMKPRCHDRSYLFHQEVDDGEKIKVEISWSEHAYKGEELTGLLSLWSKDI